MHDRAEVAFEIERGACASNLLGHQLGLYVEERLEKQLNILAFRERRPPEEAAKWARDTVDKVRKKRKMLHEPED